jgi:hypothetical protein
MTITDVPRRWDRYALAREPYEYERLRAQARVWEAATGRVLPSLASVEEIARVLVGAFEALDCDIRAGVHLPVLFAEAGVGAPDGTDVAGRIEPLSVGQHILERTFRSVLPVAVAHGVTDEHQAAAALAALHQDVTRFPDHTVVWPLMYGAWRRKP